MLKLFRHIRKSLLAQGQLKKYLAYAIGEILLVMVGILLALQVSNWNDRVQDSAKEREYLLSLQNDLIADTLSLNAILGQVRAAKRGRPLYAFWSNGFDRDESFSVVLPTRFAVAPEASRPFLQSVYDVVEMQSFRQTTFQGIKGRAAELIGRLSAELAGG